MNISTTVYTWLKKLKIPVSKKYIEQQLNTHPDYPSLLSITDTLDELGIENAALVVDKEKLNEIPVPFLAHTTEKGGGFILVMDLENVFKNHPDFEKEWNGVILAAEKPEQLDNSENTRLLAKEKRRKKLVGFIAGLTIILYTFSLWNSFEWQYFGLLITFLSGLAVAVLIIQHELGIGNELTEQLCAAGKNADCDAVIQSKGSKFLKLLSWADAGIIYFSSLSLLLTISFLTETVRPFTEVLSFLVTCSLPFTLFSGYYQWRIVKKWCPLCVVTVGLLWGQFILLLPDFLQLSIKTISANEISSFSFVFIVFGFLWLELMKPALQRNTELANKNISLIRFKNDPDIFKNLLQQQGTMDTVTFGHDLQLGNSNAELQIMVACNPYCGPCAQTHRFLHELVEKNDIGLTIRFAIRMENKNDKRLKAVEYLLELLYNKSIEYKRKALHDWYVLMNFEKFIEKYPIKRRHDIYNQLKEHERWALNSKIEFTPTVFVNGYELPKEYRIGDLKMTLRNIKRKEKKLLNIEISVDENELIPD